MNDSSIFTIGHGNKPIEAFIAELRSFAIEYVVDVRSSPYSKWNPQFNLKRIKQSLVAHKIKYVYMGEELGGRPNDRDLYRSNGTVDYDAVRKSVAFLRGINRILSANTQKLPTAMMCSETQPEQCHRSKLIGTELKKHGIELQHIIDVGKCRSQTEIIDLIENANGQTDMFGDLLTKTSVKSY